MSREKARKLRICYLSGTVVLIALGLLSRRVKFVPAACGDALWAMMVYCCFRIVLIRKPMIISAMAALITSFAIEFSQMLTPDWLKHRAGRMKGEKQRSVLLRVPYMRYI